MTDRQDAPIADSYDVREGRESHGQPMNGFSQIPAPSIHTNVNDLQGAYGVTAAKKGRRARWGILRERVSNRHGWPVH